MHDFCLILLPYFSAELLLSIMVAVPFVSFGEYKAYGLASNFTLGIRPICLS